MIVIRKPLGLESDTGASSWVVYPVQDSHLGPFISYCHYTESYNGHRKLPVHYIGNMRAKLGLILGTVIISMVSAWYHHG